MKLPPCCSVSSTTNCMQNVPYKAHRGDTFHFYPQWYRASEFNKGKLLVLIIYVYFIHVEFERIILGANALMKTVSFEKRHTYMLSGGKNGAFN